ncbi:uncharacterized protein Tco025E_03229 [Trypanosoma conorhini]|uniref:FHA domain-containing protein n=1 Tax=Trypanosoma conorhini TaxID=83891 RepID=A0A3R7NGS4_9TRYP|nr:uncharacterized protein Tco025E_03229 [Trypanosoma conorhini]RNF21899.1 hypothetical protein Tco025E_03229 [Trypanosoma conorhini]
MWIVYFKGEVCYWLLGGEAYTVGKKDCDITIKDDASISRTHLRIEVGELPAAGERHPEGNGKEEEAKETPAHIVLTDVSKYGTVVSPSAPCDSGGGIRHEANDVITRELQLCRSHSGAEEAEAEAPQLASRQRLSKDAPFHVPCEEPLWRDLSITLGAHGAVLRLRWTPMRVFALAISAEQRTKLDCCLRRCGAHVVTDFHRADYLVTSRLTPTPVSIAMLCRAADIVTPAFFEALRSRRRPHVPLPDPRAYAPPLAEFWSTLWNGGKGGGGGPAQVEAINEDPDGVRLLYPPNRLDRQRLFANLTFVTTQRSLHEEVRNFLPCAQGRVVLDETLSHLNSDEHCDGVVGPFYFEHRSHVVLYNSRERLPLRNFVHVLREQLGLCCVEYLDIIKSIVHAVPLTLTPFPTGPLPWLQKSTKSEEATEAGRRAATAGMKRPRASTSPGGRRTDPTPLFRDAPGDTGAGAAGVSGKQQAEENAKGGDGVDGWLSRELTDYPDAKDLVVVGPPPLPPYPCFQPYGGSGGSSPAAGCTAAASSGGKRFLKQKLAVGSETVEMEQLTRLPGHAVLSTTRAIDADDIIPETLEAPTRRSGNLRFNAFDATAHHHQQHSRTAATRRRVGRRVTGPVTPAPVTAAGVAASGDSEVAASRTMGNRNVTGGAPVNIFDIEALF